jgi:hypothetical protein
MRKNVLKEETLQLRFTKQGQVWWCMVITPATQEVDVGELQFEPA